MANSAMREAVMAAGSSARRLEANERCVPADEEEYVRNAGEQAPADGDKWHCSARPAGRSRGAMRRGPVERRPWSEAARRSHGRRRAASIAFIGRAIEEG